MNQVNFEFQEAKDFILAVDSNLINILDITRRPIPPTRHNFIGCFNSQPFHTKLIQVGYVDQDQIQQASVVTRKTGRPLTEIPNFEY